MGRPSRSDDELRELVDKNDNGSIRYEFRMMRHTLAMFHRTDAAEVPLKNALEESFLVHVRNLLEFFFPRDDVWDDTIIASDFYDPPKKWDSKAQAIPRTMRAARKRLHKLLSHLAYDRKSYLKGWTWKHDALASEIIELFERMESVGPRVSLRQMLDELPGS